MSITAGAAIAALGAGCGPIRWPDFRLDFSAKPIPPAMAFGHALQSLRSVCELRESGEPLDPAIEKQWKSAKLDYEVLIATFEKNSKVSPTLKAQAHRVAMTQALRRFREVLIEKERPEDAKTLEGLTENFDSMTLADTRKVSPVTQLRVMMSIIGAPMQSPCAETILRQFYRDWLAALDPWAVVSWEDESPVELSNFLNPPAADEWGSPRVLDDADGIAVVQFRRWMGSESVDFADSLPTLLEGKRGVLWDLRGATGMNLELADRMLAVMRARPGLVWVDRWTRGVSEGVLQELVSKENLLIVGERTYGYFKIPCERQLRFSGLHRAKLQMGCDAPADTFGRSVHGVGVAPDVTLPDGVAVSALAVLNTSKAQRVKGSLPSPVIANLDLALELIAAWLRAIDSTL